MNVGECICSFYLLYKYARERIALLQAHNNFYLAWRQWVGRKSCKIKAIVRIMTQVIINCSLWDPWEKSVLSSLRPGISCDVLSPMGNSVLVWYPLGYSPIHAATETLLPVKECMCQQGLPQKLKPVKSSERESLGGAKVMRLLQRVWVAHGSAGAL